MTVTGRIFEYARTTPDKLAMVVDGQPVTYRAFADGIARARAILIDRSIRRDRVAILFINSLAEAWVVGLALRGLGVTTVCGREIGDVGSLRGGPVSVILGPSDGSPELVQAAAKAGADLILMPAGAAAPLAGLGERWAGPGRADAIGGHILLTSGTTGHYKQVLIDPRFEAASVAVRTDLYGLGPGSVVDLFSFGGWTVAGYQTAVSVWSVGGAVVFDQSAEPWRSLLGSRVTLAYTQPQLLAMILACPPDVDLRDDDMTLIVGGGVLSVAQWRAACRRLTRDVRTSYGSTEAGPCTLTRVETPEDLAWHRIHPAFQVEVVDEADQPVPVGATGAIRVRTSGVDGYMDDEETSRAFFRDGFFYPGDLGVLRADGRLSVQGRVNDVINVMGNKYATTPIETALQEAVGAVAVCVFSVAGPEGEVVHAAIQFARQPTREELRSALAAALPMTGQVIVHAVKDFPRIGLGKIDRAKLRDQLAPLDRAQT